MNLLTIISCHTSSEIKINALLHNIKYFMELSSTIVIVNSTEFKNLNIEEKIKNEYPKNIIFNDELTDELCYLYKKKYADLTRLNNEELKKHWIEYGKSEGRLFSFQTHNIYFLYKQNDKFISHGKWVYGLSKINSSKYDNIMLTNDSFVITKPLTELALLIEPTTELTALVDSYQTKYHYPDFLRIYNHNGLKKIIKYYNDNKSKITDFFSVINVFEINSSLIFKSVKVLFKMNYKGNIHFDNEYLEDYLYNKNYPVVKIKKITSNFYIDKNIPSDFNVKDYKTINADLVNFSDNDAFNHFKNCGLNEGRLYKKNQMCNMPTFLQNYMNLVGFK